MLIRVYSNTDWPAAFLPLQNPYKCYCDFVYRMGIYSMWTKQEVLHIQITLKYHRLFSVNHPPSTHFNNIIFDSLKFYHL